MSHFAEVINGIVQRVIVAEQDFIDTGIVGDSSNWVQTSYNNNIRNIFAGVGYLYDKSRDIFLKPQPFPSWALQLVEEKGLDDNYNIVVLKSYWDWVPPIPKPNKPCSWDEKNQKWGPLILPPPINK